MRSRLEARWAAFFDLVNWEWDYEPIDLNGYIPDFILHLKEPILAEIKPALTLDELRQHRVKIDKSGWGKEVLLLGSRFFDTCGFCPEIGLLKQVSNAWGSGWSMADFYFCLACKNYSFLSCEFDQSCRVCGRHYKDERGYYLTPVLPEHLKEMWNAAGSAVQYLDFKGVRVL
jgi:hypothetical protein